VAADRTVEEIAALTGADSLAYLSLDGLQRALGRPAEAYCRACFTGEYPIPVPDSSLKLRFEPGARDPVRA
jgi:amidophosphoribosyltransferase